MAELRIHFSPTLMGIGGLRLQGWGLCSWVCMEWGAPDPLWKNLALDD